ncbi:UDP-N-acetylmuramate--L-alanine ligase [Paenibacillus apiarius]|uniref:UDP-N-acetylmuramate--L-alanine ligase n=1 Tax=Paenibacillus apiarius TaxID=46240 RepID=UPI00197DCB82|nr:UDP-N-acetylmuramate--L-alanine ligase [Paenibacillus apiarius]MBN3525652.1 UDP-N-acetylmuramate--L-alanine ligase [Paenibacillus apiarius]
MKTTEHIHFIGIGGYGMSAIARVMLEMGYTVTGSDVAEQDLTEKLRAKGATVHIGHDPAYVQNADIVVYSTACPKENVERVAAEERGVPVLHRSQMLARLLNAKKGIAVAGAHGKTTTSSMIALVLERCGVNPTYIIGGEVTNLGTNAQAGSGEFVVAEADESDGSFLAYHPHIAVVTNIEADHLENYDGNFERLKAAYVQFLSQRDPNGCAVLCADDAIVSAMLPQLGEGVLTYGIEAPAEYIATDIVAEDRGMAFTMKHQDKPLGTVRLSIPGKHNVLNAMATLIVCMQAGVPFAEAAEAIYDFIGAKRRFQVIGEVQDVLIVDDYAHHPTEIEATLIAAKATNRRIIAVFQPQRYSRTYFLFDQFSRAFRNADELILTDIYSPAGEMPIEGVHSSKLVERIRENSNQNAQYFASKDDALERLKSLVRPGDIVITMGAGDIWKTAYGLTKALKEQAQADI